jgi:hypothetical protein
MDTFKIQMREAAYKSMCKINPKVIDGLKAALKGGASVKEIEKKLVRKWGNNNLTANSTILAAYYIKAHPELLKEEK